MEISPDFIEDLSVRLAKVEAFLSETPRFMSHEGLSVVAGEGLRGGGTIDRTRGLALAFSELEMSVPRLGSELFPFFDSLEGGHYVVPLEELTKIIVRLAGIPENFRELRQEIKEIREKVELFTLYERLYAAEKRIEELETIRIGEEDAERS